MATKQQMIDMLSQCGGLSYQGWITLFDSIFFDGDLDDLIVFPNANLLEDQEGDFKKVAFLPQGTYTQEGGRPNLVVDDTKMLGIAGWDPIAGSWSLMGSVNMPNVASKIPVWQAGQYPKDSAVTVGSVIYRANKLTSANPYSDGVKSPDWDLLSGDPENTMPLVKQVLRSFLDGSSLVPGETVTITQTHTANINGIAVQENTGLRANNSTFEYSGDYRLFTYLNIPTLRPDGSKMMTIRFRGKTYLSNNDSNIVGTRSDGQIESLLSGDGIGGAIDRTIDVSGYKFISISADIEVPSDTARFDILYSEEGGTAVDPEDAVRTYIDEAVEPITDVQTVLKDFLSTENNSKIVDSGGQNRTYKIDNTIYDDPDEWNGSHHNLTTDGHEFMYIDMVAPRGDDPSVWASIIGITADNQITVLESIMPLNSSKELLSKRYNVSMFDRVTINYDRSNGINTNPIIRFTSSGITFEENGVKKYVDKSISPLERALFGFLYNYIDVYSQEWNGPATVINGVSPQEGQLTLNNTLGDWTSPDSQYSTYFNVPTTYNGVKADIIEFKGYEIGGVNFYANLIGIRENGSFDVLIAATRSGDFTPAFFDKSFDISEYKYVSVCFFTSGATGNEKQYFILKNRELKTDVEENAVQKYIGDGAEITTEKMIFVDKPNTMPKIFIDGVLPTDASDDRTPTDVTLTYNYDNRNVFKVKAEMAIQGNWTVFENKKGYEFAFTNKNDDDVKIQIGDWIPCEEFHFKAYPNDSSFTRDVTAMKLWYNIRKSRPFPESYIADFKGPQGPDNTREDLLNQAIFYTDGFPCEMYLNGSFYGIYVWRLKKERDNYMIDRDNPNHIFLDNEDEINWTSFDHSDWKVRSPRVSGYEDAGPINNPVLMAKLNRWWGWFAGIDNGSVDYDTTKDQFINEGSWVDAWISQQVTGHWDYQVNNMLLLSWDGLRLSICFYDADQTWGWANHGNTSGNIWWRSSFWMQKLYPKILPAIKERYTWLRQNGVITMNEIHRLFMLSGGFISRDSYLKEYANWPPTQGGNGKHTMRSSLLWAQNRLAQLDAIWMLP